MKKILFAMPSFGGGGSERVVTNLVNHIDKDKFEVYIMVLSDEGPYKKKLSSEVTVLNLGTTHVKKSIFKMISTINSIEPDVILSVSSHLSTAILAIKNRLKGHPKVIVRLSNTPSHILKSLPRYKSIIFNRLINIYYRRADKIVAQCQEMKHDFISTFKVDEKNITYIYNPVDIDHISRSITTKNPYNKNVINILAVGRLAYQKGFDILLKSFSIVLKKYPNAKLTILGNGEMKETLNNLISNLGISENVTMLGFVDNPYNYYYYSDLFVLSSRWEGFPNVMLEALTCGTKVVSTNCKSGPMEILKDNEFGDLAEVNSYISLSNMMIKSLKNDNKSNNRANSFDITKIIKEYEKMFSII